MKYFTTKSLHCCALSEIHKLQDLSMPDDPYALFEWICYNFNYNKLAHAPDDLKKQAGRGAFIMTFVENKIETDSHIVRTTPKEVQDSIKKLDKFIKDHSLGELIEMPEIRNPNYDNKSKIHMLVFVPNQKNMMNLSITAGWAHKNWDEYEHQFWVEGA